MNCYLLTDIAAAVNKAEDAFFLDRNYHPEGNFYEWVISDANIVAFNFRNPNKSIVRALMENSMNRFIDYIENITRQENSMWLWIILDELKTIHPVQNLIPIDYHEEAN